MSQQFDNEQEPEFVGIHRRHSLTRSVFVPDEEQEDDAQYEDSDFGVRAPVVDLTAVQGSHDADGAPPTEIEVISLPRKRSSRAPFIASPWEETFDREKPTPIAQNGFIAMPKKANQEQKTMFALQKSKDLSAEVLDLCGKLGSYDRLVTLLLIRDTFEPFAVDINFSDPSNGETPLMRASAAGLLDIVELLYECSFNWVIGYPLDVDKIDFLGTTALMKAAQNGHLVVVKYLLEVLNARVDMADYDGWGPLMFATSKGHWHIVEYLVQARGDNVLAFTVQKETPLMLAANNGYLNVVRFLVENTDAGDKFDEASMKLKKARLRQLEEEQGIEPEEEEVKQPEPEKDKKGENEEDDEDDEDEDEEALIAEQEKPKESPPPAEVVDSAVVVSSAEDAARLELQRAEEALHQAELVLASKERRGLEQANQKGWTALLSAAHYGQLYVVHYLVSKGADPDIKDLEGHTARDMPMSLIAHNRFGVPVVQPQVLAAIEAGLADRGKLKKNIKRNAVEKALIRFKRAERYIIDADRARSYGQFEIAHLLYRFAFEETRALKIVREEIELREKAKQSSEAMKKLHDQLSAHREKSVRETLRAEAQRNFFLAERYLVDKSYTVAMQCLSVCLQYEPLNEVYIEKEALIKKLQSAKSQQQAPESAAAASSEDTPLSPTSKKKAEKEAKEAEAVRAPRSCSLFGFSWF